MVLRGSDTIAMNTAKTPSRLWDSKNHDPGVDLAPKNQRQLGSQISMFQVACEIGTPVSTGYSQAKFVITSAT